MLTERVRELARGRGDRGGRSAASSSCGGAAAATAPLLLLLHGFPSSSYDWRELLELRAGEATLLAFDFLGFGLSDKPRDHVYTPRLAGRRWPRSWCAAPARAPVFVVGHDMGTSVATELMARDLAGELRIEIGRRPALQRQHAARTWPADARPEAAAQPRSARSSRG